MKQSNQLYVVPSILETGCWSALQKSSPVGRTDISGESQRRSESMTEKDKAAVAKFFGLGK